MVWSLGVAHSLLLLTACGQSDEELCKDAQKKLAECGSNTGECPETLADSVREQYECIVDTPCSELASECASR
jgi:hypothetical protein